MTTNQDTETDDGPVTEPGQNFDPLGEDTAHKFDFSTAAVPPVVFAVDGDPYELLTISHITPRKEAELRVLFRTDSYFNQRIGVHIADNKNALAMKASEKQTEIRFAIIEMMTNVPREVIERMRVEDENTLIAEIFRGFGDDADAYEILAPAGTGLAPLVDGDIG